MLGVYLPIKDSPISSILTFGSSSGNKYTFHMSTRKTKVRQLELISHSEITDSAHLCQLQWT